MIFLSKIVAFIYTVLFKPTRIRRIINRIIRFLIPETVKYGNLVIALNPDDPVVSGALAFRVYERAETAFIRQNFKGGDLFIDIGANNGYYTAIAMGSAGSGMIIACEPDPESFIYLQKTISLNRSKNVKAFRMALTDKKGTAELYLSGDNRSDNRLYKFGASVKSVSVQTAALDDLLEDLDINVSDKNIFIKIDVQGGERLVFSGMGKTVSGALSMIMLMEFWPEGLSGMGVDPRKFLDEIEESGLILYELDSSKGNLIGLKKDQLIRRCGGGKYLNIIGIKNSVGTGMVLH